MKPFWIVHFQLCSDWNFFSIPVDSHRCSTIQWRHNERHGVSYHQPLDCLLSCLFSHTLKKTVKLRVTGLGEGNPPVIGEFPSQRTSNSENASIWWRHHASTTIGAINYVTLHMKCYFTDTLSAIIKITGNTSVCSTGGFPSQKVIMLKALSCHDDIKIY